MTTNTRDFNVPGGATIGSKFANQIRLTGSATNNAVEIFADGTDADISISLTPKGAGTVNLPASTGLIFSGMDASAVLYLDSTNAVMTAPSLLFDGANLSVGGVVSAASFTPTASSVPALGMFRPGINELGFATNSVNRLTITSDGKVGIGQTPTAYIFETATDVSIHGIRIGLGNGSISTNTTFGKSTLSNNVSGTNIVAIGNNVLSANTDGSSNTGIGNNALSANVGGYSNTGIGSNALLSNVTGNANVGIGVSTLYTNNSGNNNIGIGNSALYLNISGSNNIGIGLSALYNNKASNNIATGYNALYSNDSGNNNIASGYNSLAFNVSGDGNIGIGSASLSSNTTGSGNTAIGYQAGYNSAVANSTGSYNTFVGYNARASVDGLTNSMAIGNDTVTTASNQVVIGNASILTTLMNGDVLIGTTTNTDSSKLVVNGAIQSLSGGIIFPDGTYLTSATSGMMYTYNTTGYGEVIIDHFLAASYRTAKYLIQIESSTQHHVIELLMIHSLGDVYLTQYNEIYTNTILGTFDATIDLGTGNLNVLFTPTNPVNALTILRQTIA